MADMAELQAALDEIRARRASLDAEFAAALANLQAACPHEYVVRQVVGEGRDCRLCGHWDYLFDD